MGLRLPRSFWLSDCDGSVSEDWAIIRVVADSVTVADFGLCGCRDQSGCPIATLAQDLIPSRGSGFEIMGAARFEQ